jgi:CHAT domain-containing protein/tetratricopeptide (TPR) repeat protein
MTAEQLAAELLSIADDAERREWLEAQQSQVTLALIQVLKAEAERCRLRDPRRAEEIAEAALEAASFSSDPLVLALAQWAWGNVAMFTGDFQASVKAYQDAEVAYADQADHLSVARLQSNRVFALTNLGLHREALALSEVARQKLVTSGHDDTIYMAVLEMNVGVACRQTGRYDDALTAYERGRVIFEKLGNAVQVARMDINRSKVLEKLDRFQEAASLLQAARTALLAHDITLDVARADLNLAHLAFRCGRYREALEIYSQARDDFTALENDMEVAAIDFYRSQVYLTLNLFPEAHELADRARHVFVQREMARYAIQATARQAAAARGLGDIAGALALFDQARSSLEERAETVEVAFLDLQRATLLHQADQPQAALDTARSAAKTLESHSLTVRLAQAHLTMADCLLDLGRAEKAAPLYATALDVADREELAALAYRGEYGLGQVAEMSGDDGTAAQRYEVAITYIEAIHLDLRVDEFQASFMDDKLAIYEAAVRLALRRGDVDAAFNYVERAKAGALLDLLSRELELPIEQGGELLEQLRALREQWHWHASQLEGHTSGADDDSFRSGESALWTTVRGIEHELSEAWRRLRLEEHHYTTLVGERRLSLDEVQAHLPNDTLLLEYYAVGNDMLVFLVSNHDFEVIELKATADEVEMLVATWRFDLDSLRLMLSDLSSAERTALESDSQFYLQQLHQALIVPLCEQLTPYDRLVIVPHGPLHYLPFVALHDGQNYLVERFQISYLPGASLLQDRTPKVSKPTLSANLSSLSRPLILAHSDGGRLSHTVDEARQLADTLKGADVFIEDQATEERLLEYGQTCGLLHLATHGAFRPDNPFFSWLRLADAHLTVRDIYDLRLPHTSLVTLSACETGLGNLRGGDVLGLSQGFLAAGARSLLLSLWAVDDVSTAQLMTTFYQQLKMGQTKVFALQEAQQTVRKQYSHPFYWAGFVLVGENDQLTSENPQTERILG